MLIAGSIVEVRKLISSRGDLADREGYWNGVGTVHAWIMIDISQQRGNAIAGLYIPGMPVRLGQLISSIICQTPAYGSE